MFQNDLMPLSEWALHLLTLRWTRILPWKIMKPLILKILISWETDWDEIHHEVYMKPVSIFILRGKKWRARILRKICSKLCKGTVISVSLTVYTRKGFWDRGVAEQKNSCKLLEGNMGEGLFWRSRKRFRREDNDLFVYLYIFILFFKFFFFAAVLSRINFGQDETRKV